jgi:riboflavin synthase
MFSGIVEGLRPVKRVEPKKDFSKIQIDLGLFGKGMKSGDSIAVNGTCLTLTSIRKGVASFDVIRETLQRTNIGGLKKGDRVNIERPLKVGGRLHGHFVLGHIDGTGVIEKKIADKENCVMWVAVPENLKYGLIPKGSIAVDGISLTIADIKGSSFAVALIPHTLKRTTLGFKGKKDKVNIEIDYLGKWVKGFVRGEV